MRTWTLPEHIEDLLPEQARQLERLRRIALDLFEAHGYELVMPPLLEHVESLLSGTGHDLDLATFKLVDQLTGRTLGIRADMTPQVARIDAHILNRRGIARLCYAGSVLHTRPATLGKSRQPFQIGAELYGHAGLEADIEIQQLAVELLRAMDVGRLHLDMGHPTVFRALMDMIQPAGDVAERAFRAVMTKDVPAIRGMEHELGAVAAAVAALPGLYGDVSVIAAAREMLPRQFRIVSALDELESLASQLVAQEIAVSVDLGELGGFNYESGITFCIYAAGAPAAIANGGRYDEVGRAFGRARPATGFSLDLRSVLALTSPPARRFGILAPRSTDSALAAEIARLRAAGEVVVINLPGHDDHLRELHCDRQLAMCGGRWTVMPINASQ
ncbi:MAG TPA: ATP phosphoribosyltransferase regulatory subunit [Usitatibacteraceae bacterium]|nr:ATP phosphoribosyltransferase regulatory subunit [Usitatibacteraceae bacterium]